MWALLCAKSLPIYIFNVFKNILAQKKSINIEIYIYSIDK